MERSRKVVLDHVLRIQVSEGGVHLLEPFEVVEDRFNDFVHRVGVRIGGRDEGGADTENFRVGIRTFIRTARNCCSGVVRVCRNQAVEDRAFNRDQLYIAGCCSFLDVARRVSNREHEGVDLVVAQRG